jgi:5'-deoxynucleotidase
MCSACRPPRTPAPPRPCFTGDLPTPVKYFSPEIREAYGKVEAVAGGKLLSMLPEAMQPAYRTLLQEEDKEVRRIVKAADKLAAYIKCLEEQSAGNSEFSRAAKEIRAILKSYEMPEIDYFLDQFASSFGLTLDELN